MVITLRNRGIDSYKPADYGDRVTVHRTIKDDGTTAYKIKAANGIAIQYIHDIVMYVYVIYPCSCSQ